MGKLNYQQPLGDLARKGHSVQYMKQLRWVLRAIILLIRLYSVINEVVSRNQKEVRWRNTMARAEEIAIIALFPSYLRQNNGLVNLEYSLIQIKF